MQSHYSPISSASKITGSNWSSTQRTDWQNIFARRELYPDMLMQIDAIFVSSDRALTEWTLQATLIEPAFGNFRWKVPLSLHGASVVHTEDGRITSWSDYYDGLIFRRTALASYFTEWVEY